MLKCDAQMDEKRWMDRQADRKMVEIVIKLI